MCASAESMFIDTETTVCVYMPVCVRVFHYVPNIMPIIFHFQLFSIRQCRSFSTARRWLKGKKSGKKFYELDETIAVETAAAAAAEDEQIEKSQLVGSKIGIYVCTTLYTISASNSFVYKRM